jgi:hypothetical protein
MRKIVLIFLFCFLSAISFGQDYKRVAQNQDYDRYYRVVKKTLRLNNMQADMYMQVRMHKEMYWKIQRDIYVMAMSYRCY